MPVSGKTFLARAALLAVVACSRRETSSGAVETPASIAADRTTCVGDSLRPASAAPAPGLWLYEPGTSGMRVAAMIGPARPDDRSLAVTRPVESVEVTATGDTIRYRLAAATVSLELLPTPGDETARAVSPTQSVGNGGSTQPAATYAPSSLVRLASYEPCATSARGPRIRYLRRDAAGRIVTDVMLRRASDR
jgi:hypothetical protein